MSQSTEVNYAPLLILLFIPLILLMTSNNNDENSLLTDEQKLEKQKQLQEQKEIRAQEWNENIDYVVNSPIIYFPLLLLPALGYKLYSDRHMRKTGFIMLLLLTLIYGMYVFGIMDNSFNQFPLFNVMGDST